jgi:hypothetical protein
MALALLQLKACMKKSFIEKKRSIRITCCEFFSHLLIIIVLVLAFNLSKILKFDQTSYNEVKVSIPPDGLQRSNFKDGIVIDYQELLITVTNAIKGPLKIPPFDVYVLASKYLSDAASKYASLATTTTAGRSYSNLLYFGDLHFAPKGHLVNSLIKYMNETHPTFKLLKYHIHVSEEAGVKYILNNLNPTTLALIVLRQIDNKKVNFVIRQNYTTLPNTNSIINRNSIGLDTSYQEYLFSGFLTLEKTINNWVFNFTSTNNINKLNNLNTIPLECTASPDPFLVAFPTYAYNQNPFYATVGFLLGLGLAMSTLYPLSRLVKTIVEEKEWKLKEIMQIMGLKGWVHKLHWLINGFIIFFWIAITTTYFTTSSFLLKSNKFLIFLFVFLFCMSEITFSFLLSVFFSNSKLAAIVAPVMLFATILPRYIFYSTTNNEQVLPKILTCFLSPSAYAYGADIIASYEYTGVGVQFSNILNDKFSFFSVLIMLWLDFFVYGFLAFYFDEVLPHEYGTSKHFLFFLSFHYWFPTSTCCFLTKKKNNNNNNGNNEYEMKKYINNDNDEGNNNNNNNEIKNNENNLKNNNYNNNDAIEEIPFEMQKNIKIRIKNLRKVYDNGKIAIKNLTMDMLEGFFKFKKKIL